MANNYKEKKLKYGLYRLILFNLLIYSPIILSFQSLLGINVQYEFIITISLLTCLVFNGNIKSMVIALVTVIAVIIMLFYRENSEVHIFRNYYLIILLLYFFCNKYELLNLLSFIKENINKIYWVGISVVIFTILMFFTTHGWFQMWGGKAFVGYMNNPHENAYFISSIMIIFMLLYINFNSIKKKRISFLIINLCMFLCLFTNVRTIFLCISIIYISFLNKVLKRKYIWITIGALILILIILFDMQYRFINWEKIPIINKFIITSEKNDVMSSRDIIWNNLMYTYNNIFSMKQKLIGMGFGYTQYLNYINLGLQLWAHSDYIEILISLGLVGVLIYLYSLIKILFVTRSFLLTTALILLGFFNGLFIYTKIVYALPFLILVFFELRKDFMKKRKGIYNE